MSTIKTWQDRMAQAGYAEAFLHPRSFMQEEIDELRAALTDALAVQPVREPANWYCIDKSGMATLCADEDDALQNAKLAALDWPNNAPYRAVQLVETTTRGIGGGK